MLIKEMTLSDKTNRILESLGVNTSDELLSLPIRELAANEYMNFGTLAEIYSAIKEIILTQNNGCTEKSGDTNVVTDGTVCNKSENMASNIDLEEPVLSETSDTGFPDTGTDFVRPAAGSSELPPDMCLFNLIADAVKGIVPDVSGAKIERFCNEAGVESKLISIADGKVTEEVLAAVWNTPRMSSALEDFLTNSTPEGFIPEKELRTLLREKYNFDSGFLIGKLLDMGACFFEYGFYIRPRRTFLDYLEKECSDEGNRENFILKQSAAGLTLDAIGKQITSPVTGNSLTRERVRQILTAKLKKIRTELFEDYLCSVWDYFDFDKNLFVRVFPESSPEGYEYMLMRYKYPHKTKLPLANGMAECEGPFADRVKKFFKNEIAQHNKDTVTKEEMIFRVLAANTDTPISWDEFRVKYYAFLREGGFSENRLGINNAYTFKNILRNSRNIVYNKDEKFRYVNADIERLWKEVNFSKYNNLIISSELIWRDYKELMLELDIRDGYELYYLIKTTEKEYSKFKIECRRIPVIVFGEGDEADQALQLLKELSPVSSGDYFSAYEDRFGVRKDTARANPVISSTVTPYAVGGKYYYNEHIDIDRLNLDKLKSELAVKNFWFIEDVEQLIRTCCKQLPEELINIQIMSKLGFNLNSGYIYSNRYNFAFNYFDAEIFSTDVVNLASLDRRLTALNAFSRFLNDKKKKFEFVEVEPKILLSIEKVKQDYCIDVDDIRELILQLRPYCVEKYFNACSIWNKIADIPLVQKLDGNRWMCNSILRQQDGIWCLNVPGGIIMSYSSEELHVTDVCRWIVQKEGRKTLKELTSRFYSLFGTSFQQTRLSELIKSSGTWDQLIKTPMDCFTINAVNGMLDFGDLGEDTEHDV